MWSDNPLTRLLNIDIPIIQAPMAGAATPELAAAVSNNGGLGSLGCAGMTPVQLEQNILALRALSDAPFNLNFFAHAEPQPYPEADPLMLELLEAHYQRRGLTMPDGESSAAYTSFDEAQLAVLLEHKPAVVSFHFGLPPEPMLAALRECGCRLLCSATTVAEAGYLARRGMDAIIAQGFEAGGHRGSFSVNPEDAGVGSMALVPQIVDAVEVPVIAAGGIADGRGIAAACMLGASAVQMGSAFLSCAEAGISDAHRRALADAADDDTRLTLAYSGRPCRARRNDYIDSMAQRRLRRPDFPMMYHYSRPLIEASQQRGDIDYSFLLYGQAAALNRVLPAAELLRQLQLETDALLGQD